MVSDYIKKEIRDETPEFKVVDFFPMVGLFTANVRTMSRNRLLKVIEDYPNEFRKEKILNRLYGVGITALQISYGCGAGLLINYLTQN